MAEIVRLDEHELAIAAIAGVMRQLSALEHGRPTSYGYAGDGWSVHVDGAAAELAVAKYLDRYWRPLAPNGDLSRMPADIGDAIEVRSTRRRDGSLIVRQGDADDHWFYLVISDAPPRYRIVGWILGGTAKRDEFWRDGDGQAGRVVRSAAGA